MRFAQSLFSLLFLLSAWPAWSSLTIDTVTDSAFNGEINGVSFQQDAIVSYKGYQYAVYWSVNQHVAVARRNLASGTWQTFELTDYRFEVNNAHYDISLGISPRDGTLHLSFYQWSSRFNYRKSVAGVLDNPEQFAWNSNIFGALQHGLLGQEMTPVTYPRFVSSPSGKMLLLLRHGESGAGDSFIYEYDGNSGSWSRLGKLVDGFATDINAYFNGMHYDGSGRLHATWVWRATPNATTNFDLHYIYSDDEGRTWRNNSGQIVAELGRFAITQNSNGIRVWEIAQNRGLINQEAQAVDSEGRVSMLMSHMPDSEPSSSDFAANRLKARVFHYFRQLNGQWQRTMLPGSSFSYDRNKIAADSQNNLYAVVNRDAIYRATSEGNWRNWQLVHAITDQSIFSEVQLDRERLASEGVLSTLHVSNKGKMLHLEYYYDAIPKITTTVGGGPEGFIFCAFEGGYCELPAGERIVLYGASGQFESLVASIGLTCGQASFGDPIRGTVKRCFYSAEQAAVTTYQKCADEGDMCNVNALSQVAFQVENKVHYRLTDEPIRCNTAEFGDPLRGVVKSCFARVLAYTAISASSSSIADISSASSISSVTILSSVSSASSQSISVSSSTSSSSSAMHSSNTSSSSSAAGTNILGGSFSLWLTALLGLILLRRHYS